ncbi:MAG: class I mannose-6-phosphate isomerase [Lutibacter sp.]|uniref:type I phosphomannose isomerase catalytic subunit n=1 Tax=Lutibacter sp. TaxID=1925666 RepID=UPI00184C113D|nr:type I phosphomannose isomerase catalytic subunit [Lutibacter sp.]MBT8316490.1 class I mannose-6-phosphate isomerase [Lutibacter sp.]NNJ57350.1 class I mannose-6-phosphate isomerase [Lutibacter sp.]
MQLYPIKFEPILKERIWGGEKLIKTFKKESLKTNIGESWEISDVEGDISIVANGFLKGMSLRDLIKNYKSEFLGGKVYKQFGEEFPILIKFIDAKTPLSIQVHPNNELAKERHNSFGKNEMWYIMDCDEDANLIVGFNKEVSQNEYGKALADGTVLEILNSEKIKTGDTFYIPTGRVHAIGAGTVLAEIQQTSDVTYRIYDYERLDTTTGEQRELHTDLALDAIDYKLHKNYKTEYQLIENSASKLVHSPYFKTDVIDLKGVIEKDYTKLDSFVIYMCVDGNFDINWEDQSININKGETILIPATFSEVILKSNQARILEVYL